jgi:hypothetical protein
MILRPVTPASPKGPPMTKRPVGLTKILVFLSRSFFGTTLSITSARTASSICRWLTSGECWVETTSAAACIGWSLS